MNETAQTLHHDTEEFLYDLQMQNLTWMSAPLDWRWRILVLRILGWMLRHVAVRP